MIQIVVGSFAHHEAVKAFRSKFGILGNGGRGVASRQHEWKVFLFFFFNVT